MGSFRKARWTRVATALGLVVLSLAARPALAHADPQTSMTCTYSVSGVLDPGYQLLTPQGAGRPMAFDGEISCSGLWKGREVVPYAGGKISASGYEASGPAGAAYGGSSCVFGNDDLTAQVSLRQPQGGNVDASGTFDMVWEANYLQAYGALAGVQYVGYGGIGGDPSKGEGSCTDPQGYDNFAIEGRLVFGDASPASSVPRQIVVAGFQYTTTGSVNLPDKPANYVYDYPVLQGDTITWRSADLVPHTITSCDPARDQYCESSAYPNWPTPSRTFDGDVPLAGDSFTVDTSKLAAGTYHYFCEYHPWMRGSFTVLARPHLT